MPELLLLGAEVREVTAARRDLERHALRDLDPVPLQAEHLPGIVGEQPHPTETEIAQDLRADAVVAEILLEAELEVGLDGVPTLVLERVGADLVREADAAALLV